MKIMLCVDDSPSSKLICQALQMRHLDENTQVKVIVAVEPADHRFFHFGPKQQDLTHEKASGLKLQRQTQNELSVVRPRMSFNNDEPRHDIRGCW